MVAFLSSWSQQHSRCIAFISTCCVGHLEVWQPEQGQRAKGKYLGFVGTTAGRNWPSSRFTSLKTQHERSRVFWALPTLLIATPPSCLSLHAHIRLPSPSLIWAIRGDYEECFDIPMRCFCLLSIYFYTIWTFLSLKKYFYLSSNKMKNSHLSSADIMLR